ncbi:hypothetical protein BZZ01_16710 [Nostocales cyanobacterium HT-58-2]|nr:hypothetical protein BZZ01_16710 [Nostocales cyanobacterium HT-58-2]
MQSFWLYYQLGDRTIQSQYAQSREKFREACEQVFDTKLKKVQVLKGIEIWQPDNRWVGEINKSLKNKGLVCYVIRRPVSEVRMRLRLPMHFQIYPISDQYSFHDATAPYSIAFGQSALVLDTLAYSLRSKGGEIWIA